MRVGKVGGNGAGDWEDAEVEVGGAYPWESEGREGWASWKSCTCRKFGGLFSGILIFVEVENSHDGRRVVPGIMAISSHISLSAGSSPMLGSGDDSAASMISDWER